MKSCSPDDMTLGKGVFHSAVHVKAVFVEAAGRYYADELSVGVLERLCAADEFAAGSVAGWEIVVAELEFQCL